MPPQPLLFAPVLCAARARARATLRAGVGACALLWIAGVGAGCLMPIPLDAPKSLPDLPPYIDPDFVQPPSDHVVIYAPELDTEGVGIELSTGPLYEPNGDPLFWRWFFNYGPDSTTIEDASPLQGLAAAQHSGGIRFRVRPCTDLRARFAPRALHRVELLVADEPFLPDDEQSVSTELNRHLPPTAGRLQVVWFVQFDESLCTQ